MLYFLDREFWTNPWLVASFIATVLLIVFLRYFVFAVLYHALVRPFTPKPAVRAFKRKQVIREIRWSFLSSVVFALIAAFCLYAYQNGWTKIYTDIAAYPWWYVIASAIILIVLYETYYYWIHRLMHVPRIFRIVHKVHHDSVHPTVFTSFCFHPLEAGLQFLFFPVVIALVPIHYLTLGAVLMLFTLSALINHAGVEIYRSKFLLDHVIGATHHERHHKEFNTNFGLYFTWWDKYMKTESRKR